MRGNVALQRYLQRHIQPGLPEYTFSEPRWHNVLVVPAYRESAELLARLPPRPHGNDRTLLILVLNRPDSDPDARANATLRAAVASRATDCSERCGVPVLRLDGSTELYLLDMEALYGPTPAAGGVGLARKAGCDLALRWMDAGGISGRWLCSTDADAALPPDYFRQLDSAAVQAAAAVFPFRHVPGTDAACDAATALYELRLHHYVLGLEYAGSPYAWHTLGSALAIDANAYAQVRGFPRRDGAEDFYVLNKLAKVGPVARLQGSCIELQSRRSERVPFGTGPAVADIMAHPHTHDAALFYHPACFTALRALLASLPALAEAPTQELAQLFGSQGISTELARQMQATLAAMGVTAALQHCRQHGKSGPQFQRQFHQWFDGFRTLKFIHALRDAGYPQQSLRQTGTLTPRLWPTDARDVEQLREDVRRHWGWR